MHVRLAFSVAAHLESDILLVDEVLAVGDADFQRKCMGKMQDAAERGPHGRLRQPQPQRGAAAVHPRAAGRVRPRGDGRCAGRGSDAVPRALGSGTDRRHRTDRRRHAAVRARTGEVAPAHPRRPRRARAHGRPSRAAGSASACWSRRSEPIPEAVFEIGINGADGDRILTAQNIDGERPPAALSAGLNEVEADLRVTLLPGEYSLTVAIHRRNGVTLDFLEQVAGLRRPERLRVRGRPLPVASGTRIRAPGVGVVRCPSGRATRRPRRHETTPDPRALRGRAAPRCARVRMASARRSTATGPSTRWPQSASRARAPRRSFSTGAFEQYPLFREFSGLWGEHDGEVMLDYGCGPGNDLTGFAIYTNARRIIGFDVSPQALELAREPPGTTPRRPERVELIEGSDMALRRFRSTNSSVDFVQSQGVIHHTSDPGAILRELHRCCGPAAAGRSWSTTARASGSTSTRPTRK